MLDLTFSPEVEMLRQTVRGVCASTCPLSVVRELEDDPVGYSPELWKQLAALDLIGLQLPEEYGGSGMTAVEGSAVYEELGRALAPSPHFVSAILSGGSIARSGSDDLKQRWLASIGTGESILTPAWLEPDHGFGPLGVQLRAEADGDGYRLTGTKLHVGFAKAADRLVVLARTGEATGAVDLFLVDPGSEGVRLTQQRTIASDPQFRVDLDQVRVTGADRIGDPGTGWSTWDAVMHDGVIMLAAQAVGGARYALEITVQYAKDRRQFDKPLGAFQALAHDLADAATAVDGAEVLVHEAAWARSEGKDVSSLAPMAKLHACRTFREVTATAQQIFGGIGFTVEFDIQLYFRRAKQLQISWWNDRMLEDLISAAVLDR
ncbi:MAG: acyl-CoA dehydrogenase family protein [Acidimicrobiales bacterium]